METYIDSLKNLIIQNIEGIDLNRYENDNKILSKVYEFYWSILLSEEKQEEWYPYHWLSPDDKEKLKLPTNEFGIDLCNKKDSIAQVKLYSKDNHIRLDDISTFLIWKLKGWKNLYLCKNKESVFSENVKSFASSEIIVKEDEHSNFIEFLKKLLIDKEKSSLYQEHEKYIEQMRANFLNVQETDQIFELFKNPVNTCLSLPFGSEKIILDYIKKNKQDNFLLIYFNSVSKYELDNHLSPDKHLGPHITNLTLSSYHAFEDTDIDYKKIFIMDAHRIHPQDIYEEENEDTYLEKIRKIAKTRENVVLASHHIEHIPNTQYYRKTLREFINLDKVLPYEINCKFYETTPTYKQIIEDILLKQLPNHMIIYSLYSDVGEEFTACLNNYIPGSAVFIDGQTSQKEMNKTLDDFKDGKIRFLVNPKIVEESYMAPICDSILILNPSSKQMYFTSIFNRGLLSYPYKKFLKIHMVQTMDNVEDIAKVLKICSRYDEKLERDILRISDTNNTNNNILNIHVDINTQEFEKKYQKISEEIKWRFSTNHRNNPIEWLLEYDKINGTLPQDHPWLNKQMEKFRTGKINSKIFRELCRVPSFFRWIFEKCEIVLKTVYRYLKNYMPENVDQIEVIYEICVNRNNSVIQGPGGVGKSVCIELVSVLCEIMDIKVYKMAWTGQASNNIKGVTIRSFFNKDRKIVDPSNTLIIFDEFSMISNERLEEIDEKLKKYTNSNKRFGGVQVSFFGDFGQLPPINETPIYQSKLWDRNFFYYKKLTKVLRQTDEKFRSFLNNINNSNIDESFITGKTINSLDDIKEDKKSVHIFFDNESIDEYNDTKLEKLKGNGEIIFEYEPVLECSDKRSCKRIETEINANDHTKNLLKTIRFSKNSIVIFTRNIDVKNGICNGTRAEILGYDPTEKVIRLRLIETDQEYFLDTLTVYNNSQQEECDHNMIYDNEYDTRYCKDCGLDCPFPFKKKKWTWRVHTFPIELNWATSVHKVQGKTIPSICVVHLPDKNKAFQLSIYHLYVCFSRPTDPKYLYIIGKIDYTHKNLKHDKQTVDAIQHGFLNFEVENIEEKEVEKNTWKFEKKWYVKVSQSKKPGDIVLVTRANGETSRTKLVKFFKKYKDSHLWDVVHI